MTKNPSEPEPARRPHLAVLSAWLVPGAGHFYLGRRLRGVLFFVIVLVTLLVGWSLEGNLYTFDAAQPMSILGTLGEMGLGVAYFALRFVVDYQGTLTAPGYEYGTTFLLTAGLMNLLLVLDAWDISRGRKE